MLKIIFRILLIAVMALASTAVFAQSEKSMRGKNVPESFSWSEQNTSKFSYRLLSMDGKRRTFFVRVKDSFAPVEATAERSFDSIYYSNTPNVTFFKRTPDGKDFLFTPVFTVGIGADKEDVLICISEIDGTMLSRVVDISTKNLGAGVFAVVNLSKRPFGVAIDNKLLRVEPFEMAKRSYSANDDIIDVSLKFYSLAGKPTLSFERYISFITSQNVTFYVFDVPTNKDDSNHVPFLMRYGKPPRKN